MIAQDKTRMRLKTNTSTEYQKSIKTDWELNKEINGAGLLSYNMVTLHHNQGR